MMTGSIWVDADACPKVIKDILYRAAERTGVTVTLVANQALAYPRIPSLRFLQVSSGFDVADNEIVKRVSHGDLVVTADGAAEPIVWIGTPASDSQADCVE